jgi:hypothetical protein
MSPTEKKDAAASPYDADECVGDIVASYRVTEDCLVLLGWSADEMPADGHAALERQPNVHGRFKAASWRCADGRRWFAAAIRVPGVGQIGVGQSLLLKGPGAGPPVAAALTAAPADTRAFVGALTSRLAEHLGAVAAFLMQSFSSSASRQQPAVASLLAAVLDVACPDDGVIEIGGNLDADCLLLQGWLKHARGGERLLLLVADGIEERAAACATFPRGDVDAPAQGFVGLVNTAGGLPAGTLRQIYVEDGDRLRKVKVLADAMRLAPDAAPGQLRSIMPRLQIDKALAPAFQRAIRPRFTGVDTVSALDRPVRLGVDLAALVRGAGWYLTGWLLDPAHEIVTATLRGGDGFAAPLDAQWVRISRPDVNNVFGGNPLFKGLLDHDRHGFAAFVPHAVCHGTAWIDLELKDGRHGFMPLSAQTVETREERLRLIRSVDPYKPSAGEIVERCLGPLLVAARSAPQRTVGQRTLRAAPASGNAALVVPVVESGVRTNVVVATLAARHPGAGIDILFVCSPAVVGQGASLLRQIEFYGLDAGVIVADASIDLPEALSIGADATAAAKLIFLSPGTHPCRDGWAVALVDALGDGTAPAAASPTLLYEDWSVRYAGMDEVRFGDAAPYAEPVSARAGYPRSWVEDRQAMESVQPTIAGAIDCCAVTRSALHLAKGFQSAAAQPAFDGLDFFLRLRAAGGLVGWVPSVECYALDTGEAAAEPHAQIADLADRWALRHAWGGRLAATTRIAPSGNEQTRPPKKARRGAPQAAE